MTTGERETTTDPQALKALSHPLRLRLLDLLRFEGPSTATLLARQVGESSGSTSFHLRQLAKHGFIEEDPRPTTRGRERWWRHRERRLDVPLPGSAVAQVAHNNLNGLERYLAARDRDPAWDAAAFMQSKPLRLTSGELGELSEEINDLIAKRRPADAQDAPDDAKPVHILTFGFPVPLEEAP